MFYGITDRTTFVLGTIFIALLPGSNSLYVMSAASRWGAGAGYRGAAGIFVGDTILMLLAVTGAVSLLRATPELFMVAKYAGAAYLSWVGFGLLRGALATWRRGDDNAGEPGGGRPDYPLVRGTPHPFSRRSRRRARRTSGWRPGLTSRSEAEAWTGKRSSSRAATCLPIRGVRPKRLRCWPCAPSFRRVSVGEGHGRAA